MDTTPNALSMVLDLLAKHPKASTARLLRRELLDAQDGGKDLGDGALVDLPYLDAVCRETACDCRCSVISIGPPLNECENSYRKACTF